MSLSIGMMTFPIDGKMENVPNHQPVKHAKLVVPQLLNSHHHEILSQVAVRNRRQPTGTTPLGFRLQSFAMLQSGIAAGR